MTTDEELGLPLTECFITLQGEGPAAGRPATFIRFGGCNLSCSWCFAPDTPILMADWTEKPIKDVRVGDYVMSYRKRRYEVARVERTIARGGANRVTVGYGDRQLVCTPDHIFATPHHLDGRRRSRADELAGRHLRVTKLDGWLPDETVRTEDWWTGWLQGVVLGDGHVGMSEASPYLKVWLRVCDRELAEAFCVEINRRGANCTVREAKRRTVAGKQVYSVVVNVSKVPELVGLPDGDEAVAGFLAGFFDAEGSVSRGQLTMSQADNKTLDRVEKMCLSLGIPVTVDPYQGEATAGRVTVNGLANIDRFLRLTRPVLTRKSHAHRRPERQLAAVPVEYVKEAELGTVVNLTTSSGYFFANGALVEQCDSAFTWDATRFDLREQIKRRPVSSVLKAARPAPIAVLTGGEPLLHQHTPAWSSLVRGLTHAGKQIHLETNGTIEPNTLTRSLLTLAVVSPKLTHASASSRTGVDPYVPEVLEVFAALAKEGRAIVKYVVQTVDDCRVAVNEAVACGFPKDAIWLMPEGTSTEALQARWPMVCEAALNFGVNATHRLHVLAWGDERGH